MPLQWPRGATRVNQEGVNFTMLALTAMRAVPVGVQRARCVVGGMGHMLPPQQAPSSPQAPETRMRGEP